MATTIKTAKQYAEKVMKEIREEGKTKKSGSANYEAAIMNGDVIGEGKYVATTPHHMKDEEGGYCYVNTFNAYREAMMVAIIEKSLPGEVKDVWISWNEKKGYRIMKTHGSEIVEVPVSEDVVGSFMGDEINGEMVDYKATICRM